MTYCFNVDTVPMNELITSLLAASLVYIEVHVASEVGIRVTTIFHAKQSFVTQ